MRAEARRLRLAVAVASLVPIGAGGAGVLFGPAGLGFATAGMSDLDSHVRYLSGLLLGIGLAFASTIPRIETHTARFLLLACIVMIGGFGRLCSLLAVGTPSPAMLAALAMELLVTPGLAVWQHRVAKMAANTRDPAAG